MVPRHRGMPERALMERLPWAGCRAADGSAGCAQLMHQEGLGKNHLETVTPQPFLGCEICFFHSFPSWSVTGQVRIFLIDSILVGFSVLLPCCLGCVV